MLEVKNENASDSWRHWLLEGVYLKGQRMTEFVGPNAKIYFYKLNQLDRNRKPAKNLILTGRFHEV